MVLPSLRLGYLQPLPGKEAVLSTFFLRFSFSEAVIVWWRWDAERVDVWCVHITQPLRVHLCCVLHTKTAEALDLPSVHCRK
jgi:hypothetical protein